MVMMVMVITVMPSSDSYGSSYLGLEPSSAQLYSTISAAYPSSPLRRRNTTHRIPRAGIRPSYP